MVSAISLLALGGWAIDVPALTGWRDGLLPMAPATAVLLLALGTAIVLCAPPDLTRSRRALASALSMATALCASVLLTLRLTGTLLPIEHLGVAISGSVNGAPLGYIAWSTAFCVLLTSGSLALWLRTDGARRLVVWPLVVGGAVVAGAGLGLSLTNLVGGQVLLSGAHIAPALNTSVCLLLLGLSSFVLASRSLTQARGHLAAPRLSRLFVGATLLVLSTSAAVGGYAFYSQEVIEIWGEAGNELQTISALRLREVQGWRAARQWDAAQVFHNDAFALLVEEQLARPVDAPLTGALKTWLERFPTSRDYDRVVLLDAVGRARASVPNAPLSSAAMAALAASAARAVRTQQPSLQDVVLDPDTARPALAIVIPIANSSTPERTLGVLHLRIEPAASLYPLFSGWPTGSATAETLMARPDGDDVVFVTPLRFDPQAVLRRRLSIQHPDVLAGKAARGETGIVEGTDYRGVPVLGAVQAVSGSPWLMISRIDIAELNLELRKRLWLIVSFVGMVIFGAAGGLGWIWRHQRVQFDQQQMTLTTALQESEERQRLAMRAANQGLWDMDVPTGRVIVSPDYARILGFDPLTFVETHQRWVERIHPDDAADVLTHFTDYMSGRCAEYRAEYRQRTATDDWRWILSVGRVLSRDAAGQALRMLGTITDISDRKIAEETLRRSEEALRTTAAQLRGLLQNSPTIIYTMEDHDGVLTPVEVSDNIERIVGFSRDEALADGWWYAHLMPDDRAHAMSSIVGLADRDDVSHEFRFVKKDGTICWVQDSLRVVERDGSRPLRVVGAWSDITARKQAELRSRRLTQLYATLSDCNEAIMRAANEAALFPAVCRAAVEHGAISMAWIGLVDPLTSLVVPAAAFGTGADYVEGLDISVRTDHPQGRGPTGTSIREDRAVWTEDFSRDPSTSPWRTRGLAYGWTASGSLPLTQEGRPIGALMIYAEANTVLDAESRALLTELAANISYALDYFARERRRSDAESRLHVSEERYRTIFAESSLPMLLIDPDTQSVRDANAAAVQFYGWPVDELRGRPLSAINVLPETDLQREVNLAASGERKHFDFRHRLASGEVRNVEAFTGIVTVGADRLLLSSVVDVTARHQMEEALRSSLHEKEVLLREVHHRVKNNLQLITSLLRLESGRTTVTAVRTVLGEMQGRILSMALLHETLYRSGNLAQIDLSRYLEQLARQLFRSMAPSSGVTLKVELDAALVELDQAHPCGLLVNELLSNALKHAFPDGRSGEVAVRLHYDAAGPMVRLEVSDTGVGLPADVEDRQANSLGLHLVSVLTRQLQGTLDIGQGPGTHFRVAFTPKSPQTDAGRPE